MSTTKKTVAKASAQKNVVKKSAVKTSARRKVSTSRSVTRVPMGAKIVMGSEPNNFRKGSGAYKRVETVLKNRGKTREQLERLSGVRSTTVPTVVRMGIMKIAA